MQGKTTINRYRGLREEGRKKWKWKLRKMDMVRIRIRIDRETDGPTKSIALTWHDAWLVLALALVF